MKISIATELDYTFSSSSDVLLQIEAAPLPDQQLLAAHIAVSETPHFARVPGHQGIGDRIWLRVEGGRLTVSYTATVSIGRTAGDCSALSACPPHLLPGDTIEYLMPSRYCPSDLFQNFVDAEFGGTQGGARITAIHDWVAAHFTYVPGVSDASTTALESFVMRQGICRDYAHVMIALARASAIPARFASVYAPDVVPQDFHAVAEVFLDGGWHPIDATGMATPDTIATIGVGRDAADVSFLTSYGFATLDRQSVHVVRV